MNNQSSTNTIGGWVWWSNTVIEALSDSNLPIPSYAELMQRYIKGEKWENVVRGLMGDVE